MPRLLTYFQKLPFILLKRLSVFSTTLFDNEKKYDYLCTQTNNAHPKQWKISY